MTTVAIHQPEYFSVASYVDKLLRSDVFVLLDSVQFNRESTQHRMKILTAHGPHYWLTIPFDSRDKFARIDQVRIVDSLWANRHRTTLHHAYARAPCYAEIAPHLDAFYRDEARDTLVSTAATMSTYLLARLFPSRSRRVMGVPLVEHLDLQTALPTERTARLVAICTRLHADVYLSGFTGYTYLDLAQFMKAGVRVQRQHVDIAAYPQLQQSFFPFSPSLSILDVLCNVGVDETRRLIEAGRRA